MKTKYIVCIPLCLVAIIARILLTTDVDIVMAFINVAALLFVLYFAYNDTIIKTKTEVNKIIGKECEIQKAFKTQKFWHGTVLVITCIVSASLYVWLWKCSTANDAISIAALGLSIISDEISDKWSKIMCRIIEWSIKKKDTSITDNTKEGE